MVVTAIFFIATVAAVVAVATGVIAFAVRHRDLRRDQTAEAVREQELSHVAAVGRHVAWSVGIPDQRGDIEYEYETGYEEPEPRHRRP